MTTPTVHRPRASKRWDPGIQDPGQFWQNIRTILLETHKWTVFVKSKKINVPIFMLISRNKALNTIQTSYDALCGLQIGHYSEDPRHLYSFYKYQSVGLTLEKVFSPIHFCRTPAYWDKTDNPCDSTFCTLPQRFIQNLKVLA